MQALAVKEAMYQEGEISISECTKCGDIFPVFTFVADTDMVTNSCVALTGPSNSIVLTMCGSNDSVETIETKVGSGHKVVRASYRKEPTNKADSFQEFIKTYKPATPIYTCIHCGGNAKVIKQETKEQFLGCGNIEVLNDC
jgi:Zn ribbon nucleic-acid-binding protein